ncbi:uncharacterized protein BN532_01825 [Bacteroides finegoldii CAG:203]|jgi:purine nucleoside permease|nr:uncharacterized protein BN532_01825 [Bacteroides finegoldii CAG:203]
MGEKPKFAFLGNSHMAFWALDVYFTSGVDSRRFTFEWQGLQYFVRSTETGFRFVKHT